MFLVLRRINIAATSLLRVINIQTSSANGFTSPNTKISNLNWSNKLPLSALSTFVVVVFIGYSTRLR